MVLFRGVFNWKGKWTFYAIGIFFSLLGLAIIYLTNKNVNLGYCINNDCDFAGKLIFLIGFILLFLFSIWDITFLNFYSIRTSNLLLFRAIYGKFIPYEQISEIKKIKWSQLTKLTDNSWQGFSSKYDERHISKLRDSSIADTTETIKNFHNFSNTMRYCTAQPVINTRNKTNKLIIPKIDFILIKLKNNEQYILSPKDTDGFITALSKKTK